MRFLDRGHVPEEALAELVDDPAVRAQLSPSERHHLDACDRCRSLLDGHRRASRLLTAPWQFVTAAELADGTTVRRVRGGVGLGAALRPSRRSHRIALAWLALLALLVTAILGLVVGVGSRQPLAASATGSIAFSRGGSLFVAAADGTSEVEIVTGDAGGWVRRVSWSPDHRNLAMVRATGDITDELLIVTRDGRLLGRYGDATTHSVHFSWAPDGQRIAVYSGARRDAVLITGLDGRLLDSIAVPSGFFLSTGQRGGVAWSPDGRWLAVAACTTCEKTDSNAMLLAADRSGWRWAAEGPGIAYNGDDMDLAWAPDSRLALTQYCTARPRSTNDLNGCTDQGVAIVSIDPPSLSEFVLPDGLQPGGKTWSPDGTRLAVVGYQESENRIVVFDGAGAPRAVDVGAISVLATDWTADGRSLLFNGFSVDRARPSLWSVGDAGGSARRLLQDVESFDIDGPP